MKKTLIYITLLVIIVAGVYLIMNTPDEGSEMTEVALYYYNPELDTDESGNILCSDEGLVSVQRQVEDDNKIENTIELLIEGDITEQEQGEGVTTEFPLADFSLASSTLSDGVLTLTFDDPEFSSSGGSCRISILRHQIQETGLQFDEVDEVRILPEDIFQP